jgi:hypothetical protein
MLARTKNVTERAARTHFFFPENAYVRAIRMTEEVTPVDTNVNNSLRSKRTELCLHCAENIYNHIVSKENMGSMSERTVGIVQA